MSKTAKKSSVVQNAETPLAMPARATKAELTKGLSDQRMAELEAMAARLRAKYDGTDVDGAIKAAARDHKRSPATYERAFSDLARAAAWDCRTPQDFLRGTLTPERGTKRGHAPRLTERMAARLSPETKAKLDKAMGKFKANNDPGGINEFINAMASRYLRDGRI